MNSPVALGLGALPTARGLRRSSGSRRVRYIPLPGAGAAVGIGWKGRRATVNERYSSWAARNTPEELPLAARYQSADPIRWHGSMVYPMYTEQVGPAPTTIALTMISAAPPAGLRGLGMGLSVVDGYLDLHGRALAGVDAWSDALAAGVSFDVTPTAPATLVTLTPVWVDEFGTQKSWAGNYGIVVEHRPNGRVVLWCSIGEGPPNFANLVVELSTAPTPVAPQPQAPAATATSPIGMNRPAPGSVLSAGPPTAPTMPVPRIDAAAAASVAAPPAERLAADSSAAAGGGPAKTTQDTPHRRAGSLFVNLQSSRAARSTPEAPHSGPGPRLPDSAHSASSPATAESLADAAHSGPHPLAGETPPEANGAFPSPGPQSEPEVPAESLAPRPRTARERTTADSYGTFGPPVAHTHPPEDPARSRTGLLLGNTRPPAPNAPLPTRAAAEGPSTESSPLVANPWTADPYRALDPIGTHPQPQAGTPLPGSGPAPVGPQATRVSATASPTGDGPGSGSSDQVANPRTAADPHRAFDLAGTRTQPTAQTSLPDSGVAPAESNRGSGESNSPSGGPASPAPTAARKPVSPSGGPASPAPTEAREPVRELEPAVTNSSPTASAPSAVPSAPVSDSASAPNGIAQPDEPRAPAAAPPRASESGQSGDPGYRGALYDLGVAMYRRGEEEQACGLWAQAAEAGHAGAAYELGMVRLRRGDPVGAESWWRTAADRREPRAIAELADLLDQLGKHAEAKSWRVYAAEQQDPDVVGQTSSR
ncbi:tetratricopeptide repeat protein [Nocardia araoensis]|uniref:tetratricopeptide repeat protein n=1 Tax=Nocardia araoensis TaxID=228600 RepID=UPI0012F62219|nr:hypothetical protein [Nocardia araoensis]